MLLLQTIPALQHGLLKLKILKERRYSVKITNLLAFAVVTMLHSKILFRYCKSIDETETYDESQAIEGLELSETTAEIISKYDEDYLELESVTKLSDKALNHLVNHKGGGLILGIERLSDLQARSLSKYEGQLSLINLNQLNDNAAESLSKHQGGLYI